MYPPYVNTKDQRSNQCIFGDEVRLLLLLPLARYFSWGGDKRFNEKMRLKMI